MNNDILFSDYKISNCKETFFQTGPVQVFFCASQGNAMKGCIIQSFVNGENSCARFWVNKLPCENGFHFVSIYHSKMDYVHVGTGYSFKNLGMIDLLRMFEYMVMACMYGWDIYKFVLKNTETGPRIQKWHVHVNPVCTAVTGCVASTLSDEQQARL